MRRQFVRWITCTVAVTVALCAAGTVRSQPARAVIEVSDGVGHRLRLSAAPKRIVTLLPSLTETVCALQACARLVGTDRYSNWPAAVRALPKLGGIDDTSIEAIVALKPDVVLVARSARVIDRLDELGIPVLALETTSLEGSHQLMLQVAKLLGDEQAGDRAWAAIEDRIRMAAGRVPVRYRGLRVYFEVADAPYAASEGSFIGELLSRLGLANSVPARLGPFPRLNPEFVVRAKPDIIMSSKDELASMPSRPGWDALAALREGRACGFGSESMDVVVRPGPRLGEAAEILAQCLANLPQDRRP